jgi:hypothetical protein
MRGRGVRSVRQAGEQSSAVLLAGRRAELDLRSAPEKNAAVP